MCMYVYVSLQLSVYAEFGFFLNGTFFSNNSIVLLSDIGEGSNALFCLTDRTQCCTTPGRGQWIFPNNSDILFRSIKIYRIRSFSSLILNRESDVVGPTGIFTCQIPTNQDVTNMDLYIGVYGDASEGVLGMHCLLCMSHYISTIRFTHCITVL